VIDGVAGRHPHTVVQHWILTLEHVVESPAYRGDGGPGAGDDTTMIGRGRGCRGGQRGAGVM